MIASLCKTCIFLDLCSDRCGCEDYCPIEECSDDIIEERIKKRYDQFYEEWMEYTRENWD